MTTLSEHWNAIFATKSETGLGWYENDVSQTLKFIDRIPQTQSATIFLPGAGTSMLVDELLGRGHKLILNDISGQALKTLRTRIGTNNNLTWLHHDISVPVPDDTPVADIWIDRAVLHFLVEEAEIEGYFANLQSATSKGGHVLLAEFSAVGAKECAGLETHRYSIEEMTRRMGPSFRLLDHEYYTYISPTGGQRPYIYALYKKHYG